MDIKCNLSSYLDRLRLEEEIINNALNALRRCLPNPNIKLVCEISEPTHYGPIIIAAANGTHIVVFLAALDGGVLYTIDKYFNHTDFARMSDAECKTALQILMAQCTMTICHEAVHIMQNVDPGMVNYKPYNDVIEEDAIWRGMQLAKYLLPNIPEEIFDFESKFGYSKPMMYTIKDINSLINDLHRYYVLNIRYSILGCYINNTILDNLFGYSYNIVIINELNGNNETIYIKREGIYLNPSIEFTNFIYRFKFEPSINQLEIFTKADYDEVEDMLTYTIRVCGRWLLPPFIDNVYNHYGVAPIYDEYKERLDGLK